MSKDKAASTPVAPGGTIGILGGGQLGRMLAQAASGLGFRTHIYSDEPDAPAFAVAAAHTLAHYDDAHALERFAAACDVVTFEFENVPAATAEILAGRKPIYPGARALAITQDRLDEKRFVAGLGLRTAPFAAVASPNDAEGALAHTGAPAILKTRRLGYDGKGQMKVADAAQAGAAFRSFKDAPSILEGFVDFAFEASVVAARGRDGSFAAYDPPENLHGDHILRRSSVPSRLNAAQCAEAKEMAKKIADALDYVGVLAVELFVAKEGGLLVNEIAPRVHNSGHWTQDACLVSQFEQHIRAVAGWPLGNPVRHSDAVMENLIGEDVSDWLRLASSGGALHLYGKKTVRPGRKMGHITRLKPRTGA
jgi:5-(carboxyamino)imidazole ribonucleotide synthase